MTIDVADLRKRAERTFPQVYPSELTELLDAYEECEWWEAFRKRGVDLEIHRDKGCICPRPEPLPDGTFAWEISDTCEYHATAAKYPMHHGIPWNCPTYYDGCNCDGTINDLRKERERLRAALSDIAYNTSSSVPLEQWPVDHYRDMMNRCIGIAARALEGRE
ncbi:MAG: hypothetical protein WC054_12075 [Candidatus Nanopelagicales bacterium]